LKPPDTVAADPGSVVPTDKASVDYASNQDLPALLNVTASPWANVAVDGEPAGVTPLTNGLSVAAGRHVVTFSHPQFPDYEETVDLVANETTSVSISMWSTVARLHLTVSPWAEVLVDGIVRDTIPMTSPIIMRPGSSILTLRHPELGSWSETLFLQADSTYELRYNLYDLTRRD
jgi:hypothetical protein